MTTQQTALSDVLLSEALGTRADGPTGSAEFLDGVLLAVESTSQSRGWQWPRISGSRRVVLLIAVALLATAIIGLGLGAGAWVRVVTPIMPTPVAALGKATIAYVGAHYSWDGSRDRYGGPILAASDPRIFEVPSGGGEPSVIAPVPAPDRQDLIGFSTVGPAVHWSPDGTRIAFRLRNDAPGIYVVNRDGSGMTRLTDLRGPNFATETGGFDWSPDSTRIAFTSPNGIDGPGGDNSGTLYVVDTRDDRLTKVTGPNERGGAIPPVSWSPDGSRIAFARSSGQLRSSTNSLLVVDADGSDEAVLVELFNVDLGPLAWSPDGSRIAFMRGITPDNGGGLWVMNADGSDLHRVGAGQYSTEVRAIHDVPFAWSPDGSWIGMLGGPESPGFVGEPGSAIALVAPDGSRERGIGRAGDGHDGVGHFDWAPDGSQLVFSDGGGAEVASPSSWSPPSMYVINVDGTGQRWIAAGEYPDWSR